MGRLVHTKLLRSDNNCRVCKLHNEAIVNLLRKLSSAQGGRKFFRAIAERAEVLDKVEYGKLRQMLCDELYYYVLLGLYGRLETKLNFPSILSQRLKR